MKIYVIYITFFSSYSAGQPCGDGLRAGASGRSTNTKRIFSLIIFKIRNATLLQKSFFYTACLTKYLGKELIKRINKKKKQK